MKIKMSAFIGNTPTNAEVPVMIGAQRALQSLIKTLETLVWQVMIYPFYGQLL